MILTCRLHMTLVSKPASNPEAIVKQKRVKPAFTFTDEERDRSDFDFS
ncbi:unnamed protein product [Nezara viridula]|uniref:Uncharacterized protein n=1 Tax=Nezara viridula TaxID=85310 RepID=A0A9P0MT87_NEZVI|nr:unnamed protein product [Nezara viridula]